MKRVGIAAVFTGPGQPLQIRRFDVQSPEPGEILVRVTGCTLCGSDLVSFEGRRPTPLPTILGHEVIGRVEEFGADAPRQDRNGLPLKPGDRLTWTIVASCSQCFYCLRQLPQKCEAMVKYGHELVQPGRVWTGGLAEYCMLAPGTAIFRLPDSLSDEAACPANCATATVAAALRAAGELKDRVALIQGAGMLGVTACAMARAAGAAEVICCDIKPARLTKAEEFGATRAVLSDDLAAAVRKATGKYGVDVALEFSGSPDAFISGLSSLRIGGIYTLVGGVFPTPPTPIQMEDIIRRQLTIRGVHNYRPEDLQTALHFLEMTSQLPFDRLVTDWTPLADAERAFQRAKDSAVFRIGIRN